MKNMNEYIDQIGHINFEKLDFTEADGMILAQLSYLNYSLMENTVTTFSDFSNEHLIYQMCLSTWNMSSNLLLLKKIITSNRYKNIEIINPIQIFDEVKEQQFSAVTFKIKKDTYCVSYRGTSATFVGWKENFNMSYLKALPSQIDAQQYFSDTLNKYPGTYYLVGHSKGGNLATYSALNVSENEANHVKVVYNFDGPGLQYLNPLRNESNHLIIKKFIPCNSIIGILFEDRTDYIIAKSIKNGFFQHDLHTWMIDDHHKIIREVEQSWISLYVQRLSNTIYDTVDIETKKECLNELFAIALQLNSPNLAEGLKLDKENMTIVLLAYKNIDKQSKKKIQEVIKLILITSIQEIFQK